MYTSFPGRYFHFFPVRFGCLLIIFAFLCCSCEEAVQHEFMFLLELIGKELACVFIYAAGCPPPTSPQEKSVRSRTAVTIVLSVDSARSKCLILIWCYLPVRLVRRRWRRWWRRRRRGGGTGGRGEEGGGGGGGDRHGRGHGHVRRR